jgi:hypothetical protein
MPMTRAADTLVEVGIHSLVSAGGPVWIHTHGALRLFLPVYVLGFVSILWKQQEAPKYLCGRCSL